MKKPANELKAASLVSTASMRFHMQNMQLLMSKATTAHQVADLAAALQHLDQMLNAVGTMRVRIETDLALVRASTGVVR